jgi:hypothetical protein
LKSRVPLDAAYGGGIVGIAMMDKLLAGSPVGDEIAFGYEIAIEGHGADKQNGKDKRQRAWDRN